MLYFLSLLHERYSASYLSIVGYRDATVMYSYWQHLQVESLPSPWDRFPRHIVGIQVIDCRYEYYISYSYRIKEVYICILYGIANPRMFLCNNHKQLILAT